MPEDVGVNGLKAKQQEKRKGPRMSGTNGGTTKIITYVLGGLLLAGIIGGFRHISDTERHEDHESKTNMIKQIVREEQSFTTTDRERLVRIEVLLGQMDKRMEKLEDK